MKKNLLIKLALSLMVVIVAVNVQASVLELRQTTGPGWLAADLVLDSSGELTIARMLSPGGSLGQPVQVATLSSFEMEKIKNLIAMETEGQLVRTNPKQTYNPGGMAYTYTLTLANGRSFDFAKNISGVDFAVLNDVPGQTLVQILNGMLKLTDQLNTP